MSIWAAGKEERDDAVAAAGCMGSHAVPLREVVAFWAQRQPEKIALVDAEGSVSYAQLQRQIESVRRLLCDEGLAPGDRVAALMPTSGAFAAVLFAAMQLGLNLVPFGTLHTEEEIRTRLADVHPRLTVTDDGRFEALVRNEGYPALFVSSCADKPKLGKTLAGGGQGSRELAQVEVGLSDDAVRSSRVMAPGMVASRKGEKLCPILTIFTSGSTGRPKGALIAEEAVAYAVSAINDALGAMQDDVFLTALPVNHIYGINTGLLLPLALGATSVLVPKFRPDTMLDAIEEHRATVFNGVPSMYQRMARTQREQPRNVSTLRTGTIAGAQCNDLEMLHEVLHCRPRIIYGSTESLIVATTRGDDSLDTAVTGVGRFVCPTEAAIIDEDGCAQPVGEVGEIVSRNPGDMIGYFENPEATAACIDASGWVHSGDLAYQGPDGYVHIVGRKKDIINRGGYKITPSEVERVYRGLEDIAECCVVGLPHKELGQQIVLFAVSSGKALMADELRNYAKGHIAKFKIPDQVVLLEEMPYLPNGKIDKQELARRFEHDDRMFYEDAELQRRLRGQKSGQPVR